MGRAAPAASLDEPPWWDIGALLHLRAILASLDPSAAPTMIPVAAKAPDASRRLGLLAGSFNPVTLAHVQLAQRALQSGRCDAVWFLMSVRTVDKEAVTGASLEDRLAVLLRVVDDVDPARFGVAVCNRGLYVEQAAASAQLLPRPADVVMIVGFDKIVQIFDPRYYEDRDIALTRLFDLASFLVAGRAGSGASELAALLAKPENRRFAGRVAALGRTSPRSLAHLSSTRIREALAGSSRAFEGDVPRAVVRFVRETGAYGKTSSPSDRYALRAALIDALATLGDNVRGADLRRLLGELTEQRPDAEFAREALMTLSASEGGQALAAWLDRDGRRRPDGPLVP